MNSKSIKILAVVIMMAATFSQPVYAGDLPAYQWISKTPTKTKNCYQSGYCLSVKVDQAWVKKCLDGDGDDVSVEIMYLDSKGKMLRSGWDPRGKRIKGQLVHFPDANRSVFDAYGQERPIKFSKAVVNSIVCVWY